MIGSKINQMVVWVLLATLLIDRDFRSLQRWVAESRAFLEDVVSPEANSSYERVSEMFWKTGPHQTKSLLRAAVDDLTSFGGLQTIRSALKPVERFAAL